MHITGLLRWLSGKELTCQSRRHRKLGLDPWVGKISWIRIWQPTPVFLPGKFHEQRSLVGYSPWCHKQLDMTEHTHTHTHTHNALHPLWGIKHFTISHFPFLLQLLIFIILKLSRFMSFTFFPLIKLSSSVTALKTSKNLRPPNSKN